MQSISISSLTQKFRHWDWDFVKGSTLLSIGMALARVLGLAFSLILAGVFSPESYGAIQYAITLAMLVSIGTEPFGQHVLARFIAKYKEDSERLRSTLANAWMIQGMLFMLTLLIATPILLKVSELAPGILITFLGFTVFYSYWGLSRGFLAPQKLTAAYLGSNIVQLILVFLLIRVLGIRSPLLALIIYGTSYFLPLALLQHYWPLGSFRVDRSLLHRKTIIEILRLAGPIWISHAGYLLYISMDILLLEHFLGMTAVGVYRLAKTLAVVLTFVPEGIGTLLLPKVAASPKQAHRQLLMRSLALSLLVNIGVLILYLFLQKPFVLLMFGPEYLVGTVTMLILALGKITAGVHSVITAVVVGSGRAELETISRLAALGTAVLVGWLLIPVYGISAAAMSLLAGATSALLVYVIASRFSRGKNGKTVEADSL